MKATPLTRTRPVRALIGRTLFSAALATLLFRHDARGFSLIGPYAPWMDPTFGYHQAGDIGGPMNLGEEYRWNIPVVTYAFDKSFRDYFGSNGVAAVEQAIQTLNDLPPASQIDPADFPLSTEVANFQAMAGGLYDLKTATLGVLLEQLGLAQPTRNVFDRRPLFSGPFVSPPVVLQRNFDPD